MGEIVQSVNWNTIYLHKNISITYLCYYLRIHFTDETRFMTCTTYLMLEAPIIYECLYQVT